MGFVSTSSLPFSITITATTTMTIRKPRLLHHHNRLHFLSKCSLLPRKCSLNLRRSCRGNAACRVPCSLLKVEEDVDDEACELVSGLELSIVEGDDNGTGILLLSDIFGFEDSSTRDFHIVWLLMATSDNDPLCTVSVLEDSEKRIGEG
ncbi:hypothetical protein Peur_028229 [Populus x canadensis]